jgi:DNA-binding NtrC family response regulator
MKQVKILAVDDQPLILKSLRNVLTEEGFEVFTAETGREGLELFHRERPQAVVLDMKLPDANGLELLPEMLRTDPAVRVIMVTAYGNMKAAVDAMKLGARDFLRKPYEMEELLHAVGNAIRSLEQETQLKVYQRRERVRYVQNRVVWKCRAMRQVWETARKVAASDATGVLITGESGTGKELVARAVHFQSARRKAPLMELNCSTFQETLLENELFGHERGAYTGATYLKRGLVELSDGGTLFLDEVGEMALGTQAKLLRFLDNRNFKRVGGNVDVEVDVRLIAATNADLPSRIDAQRFREDLYYRLKVVSIHLPPLRERGRDILLLAEHFLETFSQKFHKEFRSVTPKAKEALLAYAWPGNVRELKNLLERIVLLEEGDALDLRHLPPEFVGSLPSPRNGSESRERPLSAGPLRRHEGGVVPLEPAQERNGSERLAPLREIEEDHILRVLQAVGGNKSRAARILGLSRQGLLLRLRRMEETGRVVDMSRI